MKMTMCLSACFNPTGLYKFKMHNARHECQACNLIPPVVEESHLHDGPPRSLGLCNFPTLLQVTEITEGGILEIDCTVRKGRRESMTIFILGDNK
jgi:hypothetical protein